MKSRILIPLLVLLALLGTATVSTAQDSDAPPTVAFVYSGDVDRLAALALAEANTAYGIESVAVTPEFFTPTMAYGRYLLENVDCVVAIGKGANHPRIDMQGVAASMDSRYIEAVGGDRFETAELAGRAVTRCN